MNKAKILDRFLAAHEQKLKDAEAFLSKNRGSSTFEKALKELEAEAVRLRVLIAKFRNDVDDLKKPKSQVEAGALVTVQNSQYGEIHLLIVEDSDLDWLEDGTLNPVRIARLARFPMRKVGDKSSYETGRPGETFQVTEEVTRVE